MKELNHIDDMFQQHFADTAVPMSNQEELWQRISEKKDDRRIGFWWKGLMGLGLLILSGALLYGFSDKGENVILNNDITAVDNYQNSNNPKNATVAIAAISEESEPFNKSNEITAEKINRKENKTTSQKQTKKTTKTARRKNNNTVGQSIANSGIDNPVGINENVNTVKLAEPVETVESNNIKFSLAKTNVAAAIGGIGMKDLMSDENFSVPYNSEWDKCEVKAQGHFFADVYGQVGLPNDEVGFSQAGTDQMALQDLWETRFSPKSSWHAGAQIGYEFPSSLRISAGAEYQNIITEYTDNQRVTEVIRVFDPQAFFEIDMNGDRVWIGDTVTAINIYDRQFVRKNTHTLLHIPVQVGYDIYKRPKFHIGLDVGAALNISKSYEGQYIRSDQTLIIVDDQNEDQYLSKDIGISFSAGLHFGKYLNDDWEVYASPRFRYNPNSYLLDTETLKVTRNFMGLRVGVRRHF